VKKKLLILLAAMWVLVLAACSATPATESGVASVDVTTSFPNPTPAPTPRHEDYTEEELSILALADNTTPRDKLVKTVYPVSKLRDLQDYLSKGHRKITGLNKAFPIECLRRTEEGYYAVYLGADGKTAFVFLEEDPLQTSQVLVLEPLVTKKEFLEFISQITRLLSIRGRI